MRNGQLEFENGKWERGTENVRMKIGKLKVESGRWEIGNEN